MAEYIAQQIGSFERQESMPKVTVENGGEMDSGSANRTTAGHG